MTTSRHLIDAAGLPEHEAVRLLSKASGQPIASVRIGTVVGPAAEAAFWTLVEARREGEPLQYLEGTVPFGGVTISVDDRVLIPRPETEELLARAVDEVAGPQVIVDLCTGSGALAIALARAFPSARVCATDVDASALEVARANSELNGVMVEFHRGDLFDALPPSLAGTVDLLVANPPYLTLDEYATVPADVAREPRHALVSGPTGSEFVQRIGREAPSWLGPHGVVVCEISEFRADDAREAFAAVGGEIETDLNGKQRFVVGRFRVE